MLERREPGTTAAGLISLARPPEQAEGWGDASACGAGEGQTEAGTCEDRVGERCRGGTEGTANSWDEGGEEGRQRGSGPLQPTKAQRGHSWRAWGIPRRPLPTSPPIIRHGAHLGHPPSLSLSLV
jgi:hypothetical protein